MTRFLNPLALSGMPGLILPKGPDRPPFLSPSGGQAGSQPPHLIRSLSTPLQELVNESARGTETGIWFGSAYGTENLSDRTAAVVNGIARGGQTIKLWELQEAVEELRGRAEEAQQAMQERMDELEREMLESSPLIHGLRVYFGDTD